MHFEAACQQLHEWIRQSNGSLIVLPSGSEYAFTSLARYTEADLQAFEQRWNLSFPEEYRCFLLQVGACEVYRYPSKVITGVEFHCLDAIEERYANFFELPEELFSVYLPVATENRLQEVATFVLPRKAPKNFDLFAHDEHPDGWIESANWQSFGEWVSRLVATDGRGK